MKKYIIAFIEILICVGFAFGQSPGDCPETAAQITECGITYTGNNSSFTDNCGGDICNCVGGNSNPSNFDNNCNTTYSGGNCGSDFNGSIENSMWWTFSPVEDCNYIISITAYNCCCAQGNNPDFMQVWIGQMNGGSVTSYLVNDGTNTNISNGNTVVYVVPVAVALGDAYIMLDGFAGSECDVDVSIQPSVNCINTCPILLSQSVKSFKGESFGEWNKIYYEFSEINETFYLEKSYNSIDWIPFDIIYDKSGYITDTDVSNSTYYRITDINSNLKSDIIVVSNLNIYDSNIKLYKTINLNGTEINPKNWSGLYLEVYTNGSKKLKWKR